MLNAKYHEREAEIVAQAGRKGAVTIATNMAGRGTDILLGGNPEFMAKQECVKKGSRSRCAQRKARCEATVDEAAMTPLVLRRQRVRGPDRQVERSLSALQGADRRRTRRSHRRGRPASFSAPNVTKRAASITSCADAPAARAIPARRASICRSKTT